MPVKKAILSASEKTEDGGQVLYLDGQQSRVLGRAGRLLQPAERAAGPRRGLGLCA